MTEEENPQKIQDTFSDLESIGELRKVVSFIENAAVELQSMATRAKDLLGSAQYVYDKVATGGEAEGVDGTYHTPEKNPKIKAPKKNARLLMGKGDEFISFQKLGELLREEEAVIDPDDVDALLRGMRGKLMQEGWYETYDEGEE